MLAKAAGAARFVMWARRHGVAATGLSRLDRFPHVDRKRGSKIRFGSRVRLFPGVRIELVERDAMVEIGSRTYINRNSEIHCATSVTIGEDCAIAWGVVILDNDAHSINGAYSRAPVRIGNHVWIGQGARVLKGVTIGDGAIVGLGAVVTRDVPARTLVVGQPARVVREDVEWEL